MKIKIYDAQLKDVVEVHANTAKILLGRNPGRYSEVQEKKPRKKKEEPKKEE